MVFTEPTNEEIEAVQRLKAQLVQEFPSFDFSNKDTLTLRFYRGEKKNEASALTVLRHHINWRLQYDIENIPPEKYERIAQKRVWSVQGFDKNNRPVAYLYSRRHFADKKLVEDMRYFVIHTLQTLMERAKPNEERMVICADMDGFSLANMDYEATKLFIDILQKNYPETLDQAYVLNAPFIFSACWAIIRPWLDPVTASKVKFINKNDLPEFIDTSNIPEDVLQPGK